MHLINSFLTTQYTGNKKVIVKIGHLVTLSHSQSSDQITNNSPGQVKLVKWLMTIMLSHLINQIGQGTKYDQV